MTPDVSARHVQAVVLTMRRAGDAVTVSRGADRVVVAGSGPAEGLDAADLAGVARVDAVASAHPLVSAAHRPERSTVTVGGVRIGGAATTLIAGPCAVESLEQTLAAARMAQRAGASLLRGGAFKPRTSPYAFQGLGHDGLRILDEVRRETGMPVVTEVVGVEDVDLVARYADMLQVGARNMQNFALLRALGGVGRPVLLKRGLQATITEWLLAAEYVARSGNLDVVLCERGIRTFEPTTRNTLDVAAVPLARSLSHLPVLVDPSHSGGRRDLVLPLTRAALAAGADGVLVDVHPDPAAALCDGPQALAEDDLPALRTALTDFSAALGRPFRP